MGWVFERMVQSMKRCLRKVLGNAKLNARPLTEEYEEFEGEVLTRSHLIYGD